MQYRVREPDRPDPFLLGAPSCDAPGSAAIAYHAVLVTRRDGGGNRHRFPDLGAGAQDHVEPVQNLLSAVLSVVVAQIHRRRRGRRERCVFDRPQPQRGLQKAPAQGAIQLRKDSLAFDPDDAGLGEEHPDVGYGVHADQTPFTASIAARAPSLNPSVTGLSCGMNWVTNTTV